MFPTGLVLLGAAVVVDGEQHGAGGSGRGAQVDGRLAAVGADFEQRAEAGGASRLTGLVQRHAFVLGHEALGGTGRVDPRLAARGHCFSVTPAESKVAISRNTLADAW